jgi:NADH:ubiquinone reductase (H+-translocating)
MQRIIVLGAGFAGLWAAIGAARARDEAGRTQDQIEILVLDCNAYHSIRVRNYEADLAATLVPLGGVLDPVGVRHLQAEVTHVDTKGQSVGCMIDGKARSFGYDRLVCALGSRLVRPPIPGLGAYGFDIDTYSAAEKLNAHLAALPSRAPEPGQYTVLIVGAGLTGIELATEMPAKLRAVLTKVRSTEDSPAPRVILADRQAWIGSDMGQSARSVIAEALRELGVETRVSVSLAAVDAEGATLATGERIPAATVVWCAGMKAHPIAAQFGVALDPLRRLPVDGFLRVKDVPAVFAAGDIAVLAVDDVHASVMSCQHSRPMGRYAGHNVVCELLDRPMLDLRIPWYTTILDLGAWGAVYTEGWDRHVVARGAAAKRTKQIINQQRIYPPLSEERQAILDAAEPSIQAPPRRFD